MRKLIELHLCNFKSWAGQHVLYFGDSYFTSVIGPNGSGKSNTMDAISFVLGIKSSHLRSTHLRDLIYRGRVLKHSKVDLNGDATHAEEEAEDESDDESRSTQRKDPQSAWVMLVCEDDDGEEQRWRRTITASGTSEYRINSRVVTAKEYNDALEEENILIKARNFLVFQGDVEAVASQQPKDLTRLLEQISGSLEYAKEYDTLKAEKEKTEELQNHKLQLRRGVNGEIRIYQQQKDELDRFENKRQEKDQAVVDHVLWKLYHFQKTIEQSTAEMQKHHEEMKEHRRNVQQAESKLDKAKASQSEMNKKVHKLEQRIKTADKAAADKEMDLLPIIEKLKLSEKKLQPLERNHASIVSERDSHHKLAKKLEKDREQVEKSQQRWQHEWEAQQQQAGRALTKQDLDEYEQLRARVYTQAGDAQTRADNLLQQAKSDEQAVSAFKSSIESMQTSVETLQGEQHEQQERRTTLATQAKSATKEVQAKQASLNELVSERNRTKQKRKELDEKLRETLIKLQDATAHQHESKKDARAREMVADMKRIYPGVKGMVWQLCKPKQKKYETALPIILGRQWDSVVVDSEKTARDCIEYLKEQKSGHVEFLPLDTIIHSQPNANLRSMHPGARLAIDTIEFNSNVERAMSSVCGSDMIADSWDIARDLKWKRKVDAKIVTLDGRCITKADLISGGEGPGDRKRHFEDADVDNLRTLAEKLKTQLQSLPNDHQRQHEIEQLDSDLTGMKQNLSMVNDELTALDRNIKSKKTELDFAKKQLAQAQPRFNEQDRALQTSKQQLETVLAQVSQVEDQIFHQFCQRLGYANIREYEMQQGSMQQEADKKKNEFIQQLTRLANAITMEKTFVTNQEARLRKIEADIKRIKDLIDTYETQKEEYSTELRDLTATIDDLGDQLQTIKQEQETRSTAVAEARKVVEKRNKSVGSALQAVAALDADVEKASADRYMELRRCKLENISIPLQRNSRKLDSLPLESALPEEDDTAMEIDGEEAIRVTKANDYGIHPDFDELDDELKEDDSEEREAELHDAIEGIQSDIDKMAPNMRSGERLEATSARLRGVNKDWTDAQKDAQSAAKAFDAVKKTRMDLFNAAFNHIRKEIEPVYRDLTKNIHWPMGGKAYLDVEDEDEPYLSGVKYHVTPPGKRFRDMEHLSGGEKTMAALALLFAIHSFAPSPFFVLDEVDAALDVANTTRLANYVKEHAGPGMQFVVISLKTGLFQNSETLVGVMRDQTLNSSKALMLDLREYRPAAQAV